MIWRQTSRIDGLYASIRAALRDGLFGMVQTASLESLLRERDASRVVTHVDVLVMGSLPGLVREVTAAVAESARETAGIDVPELSAMMSEAESQLVGVLAGQIAADMRWVNQEYRAFRRTVLTGSTVSPETLRQAQGQFSVGFRYNLDSLGRRLPSERFVSVQTRLIMMEFFNEAVIQGLTFRGIKRAKIASAVSSHHDEVFEIANYESIRPTHFHPNSYSLVVPVEHEETDLPTT